MRTHIKFILFTACIFLPFSFAQARGLERYVFPKSSNPYIPEVKAYIQGDGIHINSTDDDDSYNIRRARFGLKGFVAKDFTYRFSYELSENDVFATDNIRKAYFDYRGINRVYIKLGQLRPQFAIPRVTSSRDTTFLERPLAVSEFSPAYSLGTEIKYVQKPFTLTGSAFIPKMGSDADGNPFGTSARVTVVPLEENGTTVHLAASVYYQNSDNSKIVKFNPQAEIDAHPKFRLISTGKIADVSSTFAFNLEEAFIADAFTFYGGYLVNVIDRFNNHATLTFSGYYFAFTYFLTGERRLYDFKDGEFAGVSKMKHPVGSFELTTRYSVLDLIDEDIIGGREKNFTVGLNWYYKDCVRIIFNYIHARSTNTKDASDDNAHIFATRLQILFK